MKETQILLDRQTIAKRVAELGEAITRDYEGKHLLVVSLMKGSFIFTADLIRAIDLPLVVEFMTTSSYHSGEVSTGVVEILQDVQRDITEFDVLIVDDIIDTGFTMKTVYDILKERAPASLRTCTFLDKPSRRQVAFESDYVGFTVEDVFIVGYGLNYGDYYRNVDHIFIFKE